MNSNVVKMPARNWSRPCEKFHLARSLSFCGRCGWQKRLHPKLVQCSACGGSFAPHPGYEYGYSHCFDHSSGDAA